MILTLSSGTNAYVQFITVLLIFAFVLAITYVTTRWIANYQKGKTWSKNIEVIESYKITQSKYVQIIKVGEKYVAIAICKDTITLLAELTEEQISFSSNADELKFDFKEVLEKAKNLKPKK